MDSGLVLTSFLCSAVECLYPEDWASERFLHRGMILTFYGTFCHLYREWIKRELDWGKKGNQGEVYDYYVKTEVPRTFNQNKGDKGRMDGDERC